MNFPFPAPVDWAADIVEAFEEQSAKDRAVLERDLRGPGRRRRILRDDPMENFRFSPFQEKVAPETPDFILVPRPPEVCPVALSLERVIIQSL